jgi:hypothetical protein
MTVLETLGVVAALTVMALMALASLLVGLHDRYGDRPRTRRSDQAESEN